MYTTFYGLKERPFSLAPDPEYLYLGKSHQDALSMLDYGLNSEAGVTLITGPIGSGKTTLVHQVLQSLSEEVTVGLISNTLAGFGELLQWVLMAFGLEYSGKDKTELYQTFVEFIVDEYNANRRTVLIIDEAQNLDARTLEELRMLTNVNATQQVALQLVLVGQPELLDTMRQPELSQLAQRVSVDYKLQPLDFDETREYIRHRVTSAGGSATLFDSYVCSAVFYHSGGIPRLINTLCDFALVYGFSEDREVIDLDLMLDVVRDKQRGGVFPMRGEEDREAKRVRRYVMKKKGVDIAEPDANACAV